MRFRPGVVLAAVLAVTAFFAAGKAMAAAEVHRLNLVLSGIPTQVNAGDFNDAIDAFNKRIIDPRGYEALGHLQFTWAYDAELRYFLRPNFAVSAGVEQIRTGEKKEFLPGLSQGINFRLDALTVPVHLGGTYYMQPYNQGDFQARAYFGGGLVQYTYTRLTFEQVLTNPDSILTSQLGRSYQQRLTKDAMGYYIEGGAHMFFASRYSAMVGLVYRSGMVQQLVQLPNSGPALAPGYGAGGGFATYSPKPLRMDLGGLGVKMGLGIGF